jgi:hypothetical protein
MGSLRASRSPAGEVKAVEDHRVGIPAFAITEVIHSPSGLPKYVDNPLLWHA